MKRENILQPLGKTLQITLIILLSISSFVSAAITSISNAQLSNTAPAPGQTVNLSWNFTSSYGPEPEKYFIAIYNSCPITSGYGSSPNMHVMVGDACAQPTPNYSSGCLSCVTSSGCDEIPQPPSAGTYSFSKSFAVPATLIPGQTYYAVVAMGSYNVYLQGNGITAEQQACVPFTVPLTAPYIRLRKTSEGTTGSIGTKVLFTIHYDAGNVNNFRIADSVDPRFTIDAVYNGGTRAGQNITWVVNTGHIASPQKGSVSFLATINSGAAGTVIPNTAVGISNEIAGSNSNVANVVIGQPGLAVSKSVSAVNLNPGDMITYTMQYVNQGTTLVEFQNFDAGVIPAGWVNNPAGGTWNAAPGYLQQTVMTAGYPGYINTGMTPLHDGIYICDMLIPSSNTAHMDGVMRFIQVDSNNFYMARINASDKRLYLDKVVGGTATIGGTSVAMPHGLNIVQDRWYTLKVQVCGSSISMKVWPQGDNEYPAWDLTVTDASIPGNGIVGFQANEGPQMYDNLKVFSLTASSNPRLFDTVPAAVTYLGCGGGTSCSKPGSVVNWTVGSTCGGVQAVSWWGQVTGACGQTITNTAGIDSDDSPPPSFSNSVYTGIFCVPTLTPSATRSSTVAPTLTVTQTRTATMTITRTATMTNTPANTPTFTSTATRSATQTSTGTPSNTRTATQTNTVQNSPTFTPTVTRTATTTVTQTATLSATQSATLSPTLTRTNTPVNTATYTSTSTPTFSSTPTATPTRTASPSPTFTATPTASATATFTFTVTDTVSSNTPTMLPTFTATPTATLSHTMSATLTNSPTMTATLTATNSETQSPTSTATPSPTFTLTPSPSVSVSPSVTVTDTVSSNTPTQVPTNTATPTLTATLSATLTHTLTPTASFTYTMTITDTVSSNTPTVTLTQTSTATHTYTQSATPSATGTMTATLTVTPTPTPTATQQGPPSDIQVSIIAAGDEPKQGAKVDYYIRIKNEGNTPAYNFAVWETLPANISFYVNRSSVVPVIDGQYLYWDVGSYVLQPGEFIEIGFTVNIDYVTPGNYIYTTAGVDFNDGLYTETTGRHPPVFSTAHIYPESEIIVFPNPFNPHFGSGRLKFLNTPPGSMIKIYTVSGEIVSVIFADYYREEWDGKNRYKKECSPGIYYYTVTTRDGSVVKTGKVLLSNKL